MKKKERRIKKSSSMFTFHYRSLHEREKADERIIKKLLYILMYAFFVFFLLTAVHCDLLVANASNGELFIYFSRIFFSFTFANYIKAFIIFFLLRAFLRKLWITLFVQLLFARVRVTLNSMERCKANGAKMVTRTKNCKKRKKKWIQNCMYSPFN